MSERISFSTEELRVLLVLVSEGREANDEDFSEDDLRIAGLVDTKIRRARAKAKRRLPDAGA